jgi:acyl carrier protein
MEMNGIKSRLENVFRDLFDNPGLTLTRETTAADVEDWDSLNHVNLIVAIEKAFKIRFTTAEVSGLENVGELIDLIAKKLPG